MADHLDTAGRAKTRHYQKLASELKKLSEGIGQTRTLFAKLEGDLLSMRTLAGLHAAQFMAFANIEDGINDKQFVGNFQQSSVTLRYELQRNKKSIKAEVHP